MNNNDNLNPNGNAVPILGEEEERRLRDMTGLLMNRKEKDRLDNLFENKNETSSFEEAFPNFNPEDALFNKISR